MMDERGDRMGLIEHCPTCGESGPDAIDRVGDYGGDTFEARCGDEWHESEVSLRQQLRGAVRALQAIVRAIDEDKTGDWASIGVLAGKVARDALVAVKRQPETLTEGADRGASQNERDHYRRAAPLDTGEEEA